MFRIMKIVGLLTIPIHKDNNLSSICVIVIGNKEELKQLMLIEQLMFNLLIEHLLHAFCVPGPRDTVEKLTV